MKKGLISLLCFNMASVELQLQNTTISLVENKVAFGIKV